MLVNEGSQDSDPNDRGVAEEGGIWPAINVSLIWALAKIDGVAAWEEWKKNSLARHAEVYPDMWCGVWSGPDTYNGVLSQYPGQAMVSDLIRKPGAIIDHVYSRDFGMTDFPVMNMHPHADQLLGLTKLLGVEFTPEGLTLAPALPLDQYRFRSPLLGLERKGAGYNGWYAPSGDEGEWVIRFQVADANRFSKVQINGASKPLTRETDFVLIRGHGSARSPLTWSLS